MCYKKYIVTDMDDTMIEAYGKPTEEVRVLWNFLSEDPEICLVVATGQQYMRVKSVFLANDMSLPDYIISDQGTVIYSTKENKILSTFWLPARDVAPIYDEFLKMEGKKAFVRIYTPDMIFAYNCDEARKFFTETNQKNVIFGENIEHIIKNGLYTKVILMNKADVVDKLVLYSMNSNTLLAVNTGETKYGNCHYHRFEIVSSNKKVALENLLALTSEFPNNNGPIDILCLGDEKSDFGLAQVAFSLNLYPNCKGYFAVIGSGTQGNLQLKADTELLARTLGFESNVILAPDVKSDGWKFAVEQWQNGSKE